MNKYLIIACLFSGQLYAHDTDKLNWIGLTAADARLVKFTYSWMTSGIYLTQHACEQKHETCFPIPALPASFYVDRDKKFCANLKPNMDGAKWCAEKGYGSAALSGPAKKTYEQLMKDSADRIEARKKELAFQKSFD